MKRKLYFLLERLEIKRSERVSVTILLISIVVLSGIYHLKEPVENYDPDHYRKLELIFEERSRLIESEREEILARYRPAEKSDSMIKPHPLHLADTQNERASDSQQPVTSDQKPISARMNINTASKEKLVTLPGIGPAYAERIIEWRDENGPFTKSEQLLEIRGIGERRLEQLMPLIEF